jgi:tRNA A-37 threonylcarbamoyl transferase component Bud32
VSHAVHEEEHEPVRFGDRYWLMRQLAVGGMAEIYLARQNAMAGFDKEVVIKRLKPELASDPRIVEMFLDEARIGALLNHPNIVHVYDVDEYEGVPFIAMEYIHGEELNQLCRRGLALGKFLPIEHAIELMRQAAAGMGYFQHRRDHRDNLDIVHLDISPTNLLVTDDGNLKIIDFGIARARGQKFRDDAAIPGKLSYMSPEQAGRQRVDHRSDIFSLGVVLYEITVGRRLFKGPAAEVVKKLIDCEIQPPTFARRDFPGALESAVMRCLEKHPGDRYQSAYDLADDLEEVLRELKLHSGPVRIARYLDELVTSAGGAGRPELTPEAQQAGREEDLDFDSKIFDGYQAAAPEAGLQAAAEWDEYEEGDEGLAEALGMDLDQLRAMRTPVPGQALAPESLPLRAPARTPLPQQRQAPPESGPVVVREPTPVAQAAMARGRSDQAPALQPANAGLMSSPGIPPWILFGGIGVAGLVALLYFLL